MRAPQGTDYEKVKIGEFICGIIDDVEYEKDHEFTYLKAVTKCLGIRFKLLLEGCEHPKYTKWQKFNLGARSNVYKKFVSALVKGATPNMDFDLDELKGLQVQTYWVENDKGYQNIELIKPVGEKVEVKVFEPKEEATKTETTETSKETETDPGLTAQELASDTNGAPDDDVNLEDLP